MSEATPYRILLVDDEPQNLAMMRNALADDYRILAAVKGQLALDLLEREPVDLVILDVMMPEMDGFEVCRRLKTNPDTAHIPVIFATGRGSDDDVVKGLELGAFFYLVKPVSPVNLQGVVAAALEHLVEQAQADEHHVEAPEAVVNRIDSLSMTFRTLDEARQTSAFLVQFLPQPQRALAGLTEILLNAVEHGNLGISYQEKSQLMEADGWTREVERRLKLPKYAGRSAQVLLERQSDRIRLSVIDQGAGFDWRNYLQMDPARAFDTHGRGIAMANKLSFDDIQYQGKGNHVVLTTLLNSGSE